MSKSHKMQSIVSESSRWSRPEAEAILGAWRESGQSLAGFSRDLGIGYQRLLRWKNVLAGMPHKKQTQPEKAGQVFLPVRLVDPNQQKDEPFMPAQPMSEIEVLLGRYRIKLGCGFDEDTLGRLLRVLGSNEC